VRTRSISLVLVVRPVSASTSADLRLKRMVYVGVLLDVKIHRAWRRWLHYELSNRVVRQGLLFMSKVHRLNKLWRTC
jgi:hypothetical protein